MVEKKKNEILREKWSKLYLISIVVNCVDQWIHENTHSHDTPIWVLRKLIFCCCVVFTSFYCLVYICFFAVASVYFGLLNLVISTRAYFIFYLTLMLNCLSLSLFLCPSIVTCTRSPAHQKAHHSSSATAKLTASLQRYSHTMALAALEFFHTQ